MKKQYIQPGVKVHHLNTETVLAPGSPTYQLLNYDVNPNATPVKSSLSLFNKLDDNGQPTWTPFALTGDLTNGDDCEAD